MIMHWRAV